MRRVASYALRALTSSVTVSNAASPIAPSLAASVAVCSSTQIIHRSGFATNSTDVFNTHRDEPHNNSSTPFEISPANMTRINAIIARYPPNYKASAVIPVLDLVQQMNGGWLSLTAMNKVAQILEMPEIRVYEVASFYSMFNRSKIGKYHVMVCGTTPCRLNGSQKIEAALTEHLGIHVGETTKDGMFTLGEMECMGACVNAPMVAIADYTNGVEGFSYIYYEDLSPNDIVSIIEKLKKGEKPKPGSQHRNKAEPAGAMINGKWTPSTGFQTLTGTPRGPYCRDLDK